MNGGKALTLNHPRGISLVLLLLEKVKMVKNGNSWNYRHSDLKNTQF